jgi:hypothetical protein
LQVSNNAQLWIKKAEILQSAGKNVEALEVIEKAIRTKVKPEETIHNFLETFLTQILKKDCEIATEQKENLPKDNVCTPARTPGRSKLGLSGTPARALRSQFDDAADAATTTVAAEESEVAVEAVALGSTIKLASVIVDNRMTATPVRRSARKVQGSEDDATLGDRKAVLSLLHATNFQFAPNPSLSNRRESVGMSVIAAAEDSGEAQQPEDSVDDGSLHATEQDAADAEADGAAAFQDDSVTATVAEAAAAVAAVAPRTAPAAVVYTPARTPGRSKLGLSGTPARALRSQFDDAADAAMTVVSSVSSKVQSSVASFSFSAFQDDSVTATVAEGAAAVAAVAPRTAPAAVVYTPARTPGRSKLGLSGTPARSMTSPGSDGFFTPASCFSPSTPFAVLDSPLQRSACKHIR